MGYDPRYLKGIDFFNAREFFDAHETWEELWHGTHGEPRNFIQGLILPEMIWMVQIHSDRKESFKLQLFVNILEYANVMKI